MKDASRVPAETVLAEAHEHKDRGTILLTGATGSVGSELVRLLAGTGEPVRAMYRKAEQAERLRSLGLESVLGDLDDPVSVEEAMRGSETVFLLSPGAPRHAEREKGAIDAAKRAGVRRIVKMSAADSNLDAPVPWARAHAEIDAHLRESGLAWTVLKPTAFMQNFLQLARPIFRGVLPHVAREGRVGYVDTRDVAAVAARVLADPEGHEGATYFLTGPEALTMRDVAARLSGAMGRRVRYVNLPVPAFRLALKLAGVDDFSARGLVPQYRDVIAGGHGVDVTGEVARLTGRPPRSFADFARDLKTTFAGRG